MAKAYDLDRTATASAVNAALRRCGREERVRGGSGYVYFSGGAASGWYTATVPTCYLRDLTVREALRELEALSTNPQNRHYSPTPIALDWARAEGRAR